MAPPLLSAEREIEMVCSHTLDCYIVDIRHMTVMLTFVTVTVFT